MRCGECGSKKLKLQSVIGRSFVWKDFSAAKVSQPLNLIVCQDCQNIIQKAGEGKLIDEAIVKSISEQIRVAISNIKSQHKCEQKEIALRLGVTPEYLSEVKSGRAIPSFQFFNFLKTMAVDEKAFTAASPAISIDLTSTVAS